MSFQYLLDTNVFIQASRFHYPMDVFPGFWRWLEDENDKEVVSSVEPVLVELKEGNDDLKKWAESRDKEQ